MSRKIILTCAVTGGDEAVLQKHPDIPKSPQEIADSALEAADAGAAIVHIHVREPDTGIPSNDPTLYGDVMKRIREKNGDVLINLTGGMDSEIIIESEAPLKLSADSSLKPPKVRVQHIVELKPDLATLDCGVQADDVALGMFQIHHVREIAEMMRGAGVKPEIEVFDLTHLELAKRVVNEGLIDGVPLFQFCLSTGYGAPSDPLVIAAMERQTPSDAIWAAFGCGRMEMPTVAMAVAMGGHARVGLEDNIYLRRGVLASNRDLVENATGIITRMGYQMATPNDARDMLGLS